MMQQEMTGDPSKTRNEIIRPAHALAPSAAPFRDRQPHSDRQHDKGKAAGSETGVHDL